MIVHSEAQILDLRRKKKIDEWRETLMIILNAGLLVVVFSYSLKVL